MDIAERIRLFAQNVSALITDTRPSPDELRALLETEMGNLMGECATVSGAAQARGVVIGIVGTVIVLMCGIAAFYGAQIVLMLMQLVKYG